jgi:poly-gamma-glutamate capsule biosynthesis protein CapA/YwtB (metallophosphatase superfamily)
MGPVTGPTIGLLGDVMLGRGVAEAFDPAHPETVWGPALRDLVAAECDLVVCNLECCLSARGRRTHRVRGKPFFFRGPPEAVGSLRAVGVRAVALANNHALDYEEEALADTLQLLAEAGIAIAGAGPDEERARGAAFVEAGSARLALVAVSDHPAEFAAGAREPGIAWADLYRGLPGWLEAELARARDGADLVVAFPHWGPNMSAAPAGWQRERAVELLVAGADLVAGHSAHVFHGVGRAGGGQPLLYDLGDALDDYAIDATLRNDLGVLALWRPGGDPDVELVGLRLHYALTEIARADDAAWIAGRLERACAKLGTRVERTAEARFVVR